MFAEAEKGALKDIAVDRSYYRSPEVEAKIAHDTKLAMEGLRQSTKKSSGFGFEPDRNSTVKSYTDDMGLKIKSEWRPPQYDLFMEPSAEIEMQTLTSSSGGPWTRAPNREIEEKLDTIAAEEPAIAKRAEEEGSGLGLPIEAVGAFSD